MKTKNIIIGLFVLVAMAQLFAPAKMIWERENVLKYGVEYKFKTEPVDPYDPFRGKYITLNYENDYVKVDSAYKWENKQDVYGVITIDPEGYANVTSLSLEKPNTSNYLMLNTRYRGYGNTEESVRIDLPFNRFYMEESKAYEAEMIHRESARDTTSITVALVSIKDGEAVLKGVQINGKSVVGLAKKNLAK